MVNGRNNKGANKAQGNSLSNLVITASKAVKTENVIPDDGRHIVFLKKLQFIDCSKEGVKYATPRVRFWLGIVGKGVSFNADRWLNADFESDGQSFDGADTFVRFMTGAILTEAWVKAHKDIKIDVSCANAKQVVEVLEGARADRGTRTFVVETRATESNGFTNVRIIRIEARIEMAPKAEPKAKAKAGSRKPWNKGSKGKKPSKGNDEPQYVS